MIIKKITKFTVIGLLAIGLSSPALAVPMVNVTWDYADVASSATTERDYFFEIGYAECVSCNLSLMLFDVFFAADDIVDFVGVVTDVDWLSAGWSDPQLETDPITGDPVIDPFTGDPVFFDGVAFVDHAGAGIMASPFVADIFKLTVRVNFTTDAFYGPLLDPFFSFVFDDYSEVYGDVNRGSLTNRLTFNVPEPGTLVLFGLGLLGMGAARRRKI